MAPKRPDFGLSGYERVDSPKFLRLLVCAIYRQRYWWSSVFLVARSGGVIGPATNTSPARPRNATLSTKLLSAELASIWAPASEFATSDVKRYSQLEEGQLSAYQHQFKATTVKLLSFPGACTFR
jgi:hypothetical protein